MTGAKRFELLLLTLCAAVGSAMLPLYAGYFGWSWDALNHHVYLGLTAQEPRWALDVIPASYQTYQYPYVYWPVYRLSLLSGSGAVLGAMWAGFQASMLMTPLWFIVDRLLPDDNRTTWHGVVQRAAACGLAFASVVVLAAVETTANDVLAAVPLLWGLAVASRDPISNRRAGAAAALWGMGTAIKLSNGIYIVWLLLWWWSAQRPHWPWRRAVALALGATIGFSATYAPWGWQLWRQTGNPFYPFFTALFGAA